MVTLRHNVIKRSTPGSAADAAIPKHRKRTSELDDINPQRGTAQFDDELLELLAVLDMCVQLEPEQDQLLEAVVSGPLVSVEDLERERVLPVQAAYQKPPKLGEPPGSRSCTMWIRRRRFGRSPLRLNRPRKVPHARHDQPTRPRRRAEASARVTFGRTGRLEREFDRTLAKRQAGTDLDDMTLTDRFLLQHRLDDGRTVVEHFVGAHPELSDDDRAMVLGWLDVVEGIFEIKERDGEALVAVNLSDDLTYRIRSNKGSSMFDGMPERSFLAGRIVPVADEWMLSGVCRPLPASRRREIYETVMRSFVTDKASIFRNKEKLELAWKLQREDREHFLSFFGTDEVVMTGAEYSKRMPEY